MELNDQQDSLLFESNFPKEARTSFDLGNNLQPVRNDGDENKNMKTNTKWSMSTAAKSSSGSGRMLNGIFFND